MCLHCKQESLSSRFYCQLIEEFGEDACPKEQRVDCVSHMNVRNRLTDPVDIQWVTDDQISL